MTSSKDTSKWKDVEGTVETKDLPMLPTGVPSLVLTSYSYQKLRYWEVLSGKNEISCFGVAFSQDNLLRVNELYLPKQIVTPSHTDPTEEGIATMYDELGQAKFPPNQFARIWIHTHTFTAPNKTGISLPSPVDFNTCREVFTGCDWFIMLIKGGEEFTCYLYLLGALPVRLVLKVIVDYTDPGFPNKIINDWTTTFNEQVEEEPKKTWNGVSYGEHGKLCICERCTIMRRTNTIGDKLYVPKKLK